jgi:biotin carboxyl carrier protein
MFVSAVDDSGDEGHVVDLVDLAKATVAASPVVIGGLRPGVLGSTRVEVVVRGWRFEFDVAPEARARLRQRAIRGRAAAAGTAAADVRAMIPGRVVSVAVAAGDAVRAGQPLLVVEAMKMQNEVRAPCDGLVARVAVAASDSVDLGDLLVVLERVAGATSRGTEPT